jgi:hypothetical protein
VEKDFNTYDYTTLQKLYEEELRDLEVKLLNGVSWADVQEQRKKITTIGVSMYRKLNASHFDHPAATNLRLDATSEEQ